MSRGIMATCYATLAEQNMTNEGVTEIYRSFYENEPFVQVTDFAPQTKYTTGSNMCLVFPVVDQKNGRLIVVSCLDNLVKGAAGQAVQNMNLMSGFPEKEGLGQLPLYP
jgi:N-acetyl-gamma-glutamyl-phosphate reductase